MVLWLSSISNFAGIIGPLGATWDTSLEEWKRVIEVNTVGVWLCNKYQLRQMMKQDSIEVWVALVTRHPNQHSRSNSSYIVSLGKSTVHHNEDPL